MLPVYTPNEEEKQDPELYGENLREFMIKASGIQFLKSNATMIDKRKYTVLFDIAQVFVFSFVRYQQLLKEHFKLHGENKRK